MKGYDVAIVGAGIAGFTAALTANNFHLNLLWLDDRDIGGKAERAELVNNLPAFTGSGRELALAMREQAKSKGLTLTRRRINGVFPTEEGYALTSGEETYYAKSVILATGVEAIGTIKGEKEYLGRGVSYCAVCDGALYRSKDVIAVLFEKEFEEEAEYLASFARTLTCVCRYEGHAFKAGNIRAVSCKPLAVEGDLRAKRLVTDGGALEGDGIFFLRASAPPESIVYGLGTDGNRVLVESDTSTNLKGLFAAGDVAGTPYQFAKAAGEGLKAAYAVRAYLKEKGTEY